MGFARMLDLYPKIPTDLSQSTAMGGWFSTLTGVVMLLLFQVELFSFMSAPIESQVVVDNVLETKVSIISVGDGEESRGKEGGRGKRKLRGLFFLFCCEERKAGSMRKRRRRFMALFLLLVCTACCVCAISSTPGCTSIYLCLVGT